MPITPETRYETFMTMLGEHREQVINKKLNLEVLDKLLAAFLDDMEQHGADVIPQSASYLFNKAGVDNCAYFRNFKTLNGIITATKGAIVDEIDHQVLGTFGVFSYDDAIKRTFTALSVESGDHKIHRIRFAIRRFSSDFWEIALHLTYKKAIPRWEKYGERLVASMYSSYAANFRHVLKIWEQEEFSPDCIDDCIKLLNDLTITGIFQIMDIEEDLRLFGKENSDVP